jgi:hypothetical protein
LVTTKKVDITFSTLGSEKDVSHLIDHLSDKFIESSYDQPGAQHFTLKFNTCVVSLQFYMFCCTNKVIKNWNVEGSNDGQNWEPIRRHVNDLFTEKQSTGAWNVMCPRYYGYIRLISTGPIVVGQNCWPLAMRRLQFFGHILYD